MLPRIKKLQAELPSVLLSMSNLRTVEIVAQLGEAQIDFGLVSTDDLPAGIESVKLGTLRYRICVPAAGARGLTWRQALHLPMVGLEGEGSLMRKLRKVTEQAGVAPKPAVLCSSLPGVAAALKEIEGYAILPEAAEKNGLVAIDAPFLREFDRTIRLAWSVRRLAIREEMNRWRKKLTDILVW